MNRLDNNVLIMASAAEKDNEEFKSNSSDNIGN